MKVANILMETLPVISGAFLFFAGGCVKENHTEGQIKDDSDSTEIVQPVKKHITVLTESERQIRNLDILVYGGSPLLTLESQAFIGNDEACQVELKDSCTRTVVVLANMPAKLNSNAAAHFDALQKLTMDFADDNSDCPFMSGTALYNGGESCTVSLQPLMSCVLVRSVSNEAEEGTLLENVKVRLTGISTRAELMREYGFSPTETTDGAYLQLPCDIGLYTQYPSVRLWCYPSDLPNSQSAVLEVEYIKRGPDGSIDLCRAAFETGPISRNCCVPMDLLLY